MNRRTATMLIVAPLAGILGLAIVIGYQWYDYATAGEEYDEMGIELNSRMPEPMRRWACVKIATRYPGTLPPYGCS